MRSPALLATKLIIPPLRPDSLTRQRLLDALDEGLSRKLTLVAAPAGYGKTTLLGEWVRGIEAPVAWLSLDKDDNDLPRFLSYLFSALQTANLEVTQFFSPGLPSPQLPPIETFLTPVLNHLADMDSSLVLVLDDLHLIDVEPVHQALTFLLDHLPSQMHIVIATRVDPPLPIARLRAQMDLIELREVDLRFTREEMAQFLDQSMGLGLPEDQISKLATRTEGWIAGLQLAAVSMRGQNDRAAFIEAFSGSHEYIVDYLTDEVLKGLATDLQKFLVETSILDRLNGPLCEAVTGQERSLETLEYLRESHLFVVPLDDQRLWYRYHRLFADHLLKRLRDQFPGRIGELHRRASQWYEENDLMAAAIEHALEAEDYDRSAVLIERAAEDTLMRSEFALFLRWANALPETVVHAHPMVGIAQAMSLLMRGARVEEVEPRLEPLACETEAHLGGRSVVLATIAILRGQFSRAFSLAQKAVRLLSSAEYESLRNVANWIIIYTSVLESKPSEGLLLLEKVIQESHASGDMVLTVTASYEVAKLLTYQGKLREAEQIYDGAIDVARDRQKNLLPIAGEGLLGLGELYRETNRLQQAEQTLLQGIELSRWGRSATAYRGYLSLAKLKLARGDTARAKDLFREAHRQARFEFDHFFVSIAEAKAYLTLGKTEPAERWLHKRGWATGPRLPDESDNAIDKHIRKYEHLLQARLSLAQTLTTDALANLELLEGIMEQQERTDLIIEIQILKAQAYQAQGASAEALAAISAALVLASPGEYLRTFIDEGEALRPLLIQAAASGTEPEYAGKILAVFPGVKPRRSLASQPLPDQSDLVEQLSERELQVLRLLASPLTSPEIAAELFISANTVRFHIKNIYSKLDVHRRVEAVNRASRLGLI